VRPREASRVGGEESSATSFHFISLMDRYEPYLTLSFANPLYLDVKN
jgi:hypothetical protein